MVGSVDEAFADLLSSRSKYYVRKADMDVFDALRLINAAGGVTAFAHPLARRRGLSSAMRSSLTWRRPDWTG